MLDPARKEFAEKGEVMALVGGDVGEEAKPVFPIDLNSIRLVDEQLTKHDVPFIESTKGGTKPFFLYFATKGAHNDNYPHLDFLGKSLAKHPVKDAIVELDHRIGQLRAALERAGQFGKHAALDYERQRPPCRGVSGHGLHAVPKAEFASLASPIGRAQSNRAGCPPGCWT